MGPVDNRHSVSVAGVVIDEMGRALLVRRRDNGHWEPPGGILEVNESIPDGVRREVLEETGLTVDVTSLSGVYKNMTRGIVALVFRCHVTAGALHPTDETSDFIWATPDQVSQLVTEAYAIRVLDALTQSPTPYVREHDGVRLL